MRFKANENEKWGNSRGAKISDFQIFAFIMDTLSAEGFVGGVPLRAPTRHFAATRKVSEWVHTLPLQYVGAESISARVFRQPPAWKTVPCIYAEFGV